MPLLPGNLSQIPKISIDIAEKMWNQIGSALVHLHKLKIVHLNIESANIGIDNGNFILIDLESALNFDKQTETTSITHKYVPSDLNITVAKPIIDWWMLLVVIQEKLNLIKLEEDIICLKLIQNIEAKSPTSTLPDKIVKRFLRL